MQVSVTLTGTWSEIVDQMQEFLASAGESEVAAEPKTPMLDRAAKVTASINKIAKFKMIPDECLTGRERAGEIVTFTSNKELSDDSDEDEGSEEEEKQPRKRRTKAEMEAARAAEKQPVKKAAVKQTKTEAPVNDFSADFGTDEEEEDLEKAQVKSKYTIEGDIIPAFLAFQKKHGRDPAVEILKKYFKRGETPSAKSLKPEQFNAVMADLEL